MLTARGGDARVKVIRRRCLEDVVRPALTGRYRQSLGSPCRRPCLRWFRSAAPPRRLLRSLPAAPRPHRPRHTDSRARRLGAGRRCWAAHPTWNTPD